MRHSLSLALLLTIFIAQARAADDFDLSFGIGGIASVNVTSQPNGGEPVPVTIQADGKIVLATRDDSDYAVFRFNTDGTLDSGFGTSGKSSIDLGGEDIPTDVVIQPDGKILALGSSTSGGLTRLGLVRLDSTGSLDSSFGTGGIMEDDVGGDTSPAEMALQADGKIVVTGYTGSFWGGFTGRFDTDGSRDLTFGTAGFVFPELTVFGTRLYTVTVQPDGKILAAGLSSIGGDYGLWLLLRYLSDGTLDPTFGTGGVVETGIGAGTPPLTIISEVLQVAIQPDDKILASGSSGASYLSWPSEFTSGRYDPSGVLDPSYGTGGLTQVQPTPGTFAVAFASTLMLHTSGSMTMIGPAAAQETYPLNGAAVVRQRSDGSLDPTFSGDGIVEVPNLGVWTFGTLTVDGAAEASGHIIMSSRFLGGVELRRVTGLTNCGNSVLDTGETCDDGNTLDGDCCSSSCQFEVAGTVCDDDGNACTLDQCDDAGSCTSSSAPAGTACDPDGDTCTLDECDGAGACSHPSAPNDTTCDDGDPCTSTDACTAGACSGMTAPAAGCKTATRGVLLIKNGGGTKDKLVWTWKRGEETLLQEIAPQDYALCLYEGPGPALATAVDTPGYPCSADHCFKSTTKKTTYTSKTSAYDGVKKIVLVAGEDGKSAVKLSAKGATTPTPLLPLMAPVVAQLHTRNGACFEATYSTPLRNDAILFRAKPD